MSLLSRRSVLQSLSLAGTGLPLLSRNLVSANQNERRRSCQLENRFFCVYFDTSSGRFHAWRKDGSLFLSSVSSRALTAVGIQSTTDPEYERTIEVTTIRDVLGTGKQLVARCKNRRRQIHLEVAITLYDDTTTLVVETICRNSSPKDSLILRSLEPVRVVFDEGGACHWAGAQKTLTNGYMYYDPGRLEDFYHVRPRSAHSMWNLGFYRGDREEGLVVGFLENRVAEGHITAWYDRTVGHASLHDGFALIVESTYNREFVVKPGASVSSGRLVFNIAPDPFTALESYAEAVGKVHQVRLNAVINGWCSWFYTHEYVNEEEILRNADFAARHLKPYGLQYVQIDAGYERAYGEWEGNKNFPHGMKWLAGKISALGLKPGIWVAPYVITEGTEIHQQHSDWLIRGLDGNVRQCLWGGDPKQAAAYGVPSFEKKLYGLDITHPGAAQWMHNLFDTVANDWGYEFIKIDFVAWTLLSAERFYDPSFSKAAAYRRGFELIRKAIGQHRHLLDCGPAPTTVGLLDSTRIDLDVPHCTWDQYVKNSNSSAPAAAKRYYFHKRTWINDNDHLGVALLSFSQAQAAASIVALSGGTMISGDRLFELDPTRLEIVKKVFPSYGEAARPVDLFERDKPEVFALPVKKPFGQWTLLWIFNYDEGLAAEKTIELDRLRLESSKTYVAYEFWSQRLQGEVKDRFRIRLQPSSVALLALHETRGVPQVISNDRHFAQGALELESVEWDEAANELRGISVGPRGTAHNVAIHIPENYVWAQTLTGYFYDFEGYSLKLMEPKILRVHVAFDDKERVPWKVAFKPRASTLQP